MGTSERRARARQEREERITTAARQIAERDGWAAVTIRRLADEIEYSQPVLYAHFENRDAIVAAVAIRGFAELATMLAGGVDGTMGGIAPEAVAARYLAFAREHPALYQAMFTQPTSLRFATSDTPPELRAAFAVLCDAVSGTGTAADAHPELAAETLWAALHGLAELERSGRIRVSARTERLALLMRALTG